MEIMRLKLFRKMGVFILINKVEIASVNTSKLPVLSNEEKEELLKKIKERRYGSKRKIYLSEI